MLGCTKGLAQIMGSALEDIKEGHPKVTLGAGEDMGATYQGAPIVRPPSREELGCVLPAGST